VKTVENGAKAEKTIAPLAMSNLYIGDGFRLKDSAVDLSNLGMLVKTWGRVVALDKANNRFIISDGSLTKRGDGLEVYAGQLKNPMQRWPEEGQYVMVTGISIVQPADGTFHPAIRMRSQKDLDILPIQ
jgi:hypothetical protein